MVRLTAALASLPRRNSTHHDRDLEAFLDALDMQRPLAGFEATCEVCDAEAVSKGLCERHARLAESAPAPVRNTATIKPVIRDGIVVGYLATLASTGTTYSGPKYGHASEFLEQRGYHRVSGKAIRGIEESWEQVNPDFGIDAGGPGLTGTELQQVTREVAHV